MEIDELFPASDFNQWAESYDQDVLDESRFPFTGYQRALQTVVEISFTDQDALFEVKQAVGADWEEGFYWIADETLHALKRAGVPVLFTRVSNMAGVFSVQNA